MAKETVRNTYALESGEAGEVRIADEVVAIIAGLAATEVEGVASMAGNITNELVGKLGMKTLSKGVKLTVVDNTVSVVLSLNLEFGFSVPEVSRRVQEKVKAAIENMTGLEVLEVSIQIEGVNI
ncbi:MAG: Asp23/Gls24 family envelope stress response protein [Lachnospiraceae bacterium]|nr:Asp23/Gls24 family envelope stress response protein [Cuneatibacter sp.]MDD6455005.1 Asp23/Gls24 family envelope stress response protein [Lachnospiraceae bacterium]